MFTSELFVGNLKYDATADELVALFSEQGEVLEAHVIEGRGYGFVTMKTIKDAEAARAALDNFKYHNRRLEVKEAREHQGQRDKEEFKFKRLEQRKNSPRK